MQVKYYKSLDRELMLFGVRGRWIGVFGAFIAVVLLFSFVLGFVYGSGVGMGFFIAGMALDFLLCIVLQQRIPSRRLRKLPYRRFLPCRIIRRESLYRILRQHS